MKLCRLRALSWNRHKIWYGKDFWDIFNGGPSDAICGEDIMAINLLTVEIYNFAQASREALLHSSLLIRLEWTSASDTVAATKPRRVATSRTMVLRICRTITFPGRSRFFWESLHFQRSGLIKSSLIISGVRGRMFKSVRAEPTTDPLILGSETEGSVLEQTVGGQYE